MMSQLEFRQIENQLEISEESSNIIEEDIISEN